MSAPSESPGPPPPILVVGMHSSGTSILAEVLHRHGLFLGVDADHHENSFFRDEVAEAVLGGEGGWARLPLPSAEAVRGALPDFRERIESGWLPRYRALGYDGAGPWGFKDPRSCVLLPLYLAVFPAARVLQIVRDPEDVAASLTRKRKRGVGRVADAEHWRRLARAYAERARADAAAHGAPYHEVRYEAFCREPARVAPACFDFAGIAFTPEAARFLERRVHARRIGLARRGSWLARLGARVRGGR